MRSLRRGALALLLGLSLSLSVVGPASAQELPTGAARLVAKVQQQAAIAKLTLLSHVAAIQANLEEDLPRP